jgi:serine/threonine-protein kinase
LVGKVIDGRFEILERVGEGGMGVVYKVRQVPIGRIVAMKVLSQEMAEDPNWVMRFEREARASSQLQHPNTIRMFDFGKTREGRLFMTMEFLDGRSLRQVIAEDAPLDGMRVLKILVQCCASLAEAHAAGIIHRDIKPDNVFLLTMAGSPDFVKLLDFSVAKLLQESDGMRTQAGIVFGTPQYMSPEQGRGLPLDARSDLYALGILAFEMLTGYVPFHHDQNPMIVLQMHVQKAVPPLPPSVAPVVQQVVYKALEKDPAKRYQSAGEMMQACQQVVAQLEAERAGRNRPAAMPPPSDFGPEQKTIVAGGAVPGMMSNYGNSGPAPHGGYPGPQSGQQPGYPGPQAGYPGQQAGYPGPQAGYPGPAPMPPNFPAGAAGAQTIVAGQRPPGIPGPPLPGVGPAAEAQTIIAPLDRNALAAAQARSSQGMPRQNMPPGYNPPGLPGMPPMPGALPLPPDDGGPGQTVVLPDSQGIPAFNRPTALAPVAQPLPSPPPPSRPVASYGSGPHAAPEGQGSDTMFWILCIVGGMVVGVLAYVVALQIL